MATLQECLSTDGCKENFDTNCGQMAVIAESTDGQPLWCWKMLAHTYMTIGRPLAAELCYKRVISSSIHTSFPVHLQLTWMYMRTFRVTADNKWLHKAEQILDQATQLNPSHSALQLTKAYLYLLQDNKRASKKYSTLAAKDTRLEEICNSIFDKL